jgi:two-component system CheB/CheR fusion protein
MEDQSPQSASGSSAISASRRQEPAPAHLIVVGVGASAGGLEPFFELVRQLPPNTGMAFVFIQHLDPTRPSALTELLSAKTSMPVVQVQGGTPLQPDQL